MCRGQKTLKSQKTKWWQKPLVTTAFYTDLTKGAWHATFYTLVHTVRLGHAIIHTMVHTVDTRYLLDTGTYCRVGACNLLHTWYTQLGHAIFFTLEHTVGACYLLHIGTYSWSIMLPSAYPSNPVGARYLDTMVHTVGKRYLLHTGTYSWGMLPINTVLQGWAYSLLLIVLRLL